MRTLVADAEWMWSAAMPSTHGMTTVMVGSAIPENAAPFV
jgi:hypothetical protein